MHSITGIVLYAFALYSYYSLHYMHCILCIVTLKLFTTNLSVTSGGEEGGKRLPHIDLLLQLKIQTEICSPSFTECIKKFGNKFPNIPIAIHHIPSIIIPHQLNQFCFMRISPTQEPCVPPSRIWLNHLRLKVLPSGNLGS
jgi:hypothetical protein